MHGHDSKKKKKKSSEHGGVPSKQKESKMHSFGNANPTSPQLQIVNTKAVYQNKNTKLKNKG